MENPALKGKDLNSILAGYVLETLQLFLCESFTVNSRKLPLRGRNKSTRPDDISEWTRIWYSKQQMENNLYMQFLNSLNWPELEI